MAGTREPSNARVTVPQVRTLSSNVRTPSRRDASGASAWIRLPPSSASQEMSTAGQRQAKREAASWIWEALRRHDARQASGVARAPVKRQAMYEILLVMQWHDGGIIPACTALTQEHVAAKNLDSIA